MEADKTCKKRRIYQHEGHNKRHKSEKVSNPNSCAEFDAAKFIGEVVKFLRNEETAASGLKKFLDVLKSSNDQSYAVLSEYLKQCSDCAGILKILGEGRKRQSHLETQMALEVLEFVLLFIAENEQQYAYRSSGMQIVRQVLQSHMKFVYHCLNPAAPASLTMTMLRLLTAMVTQGAVAAREVQMTFDFSLKALQSLPKKQDPKDTQNDTETFCYHLQAVCDIRTCFIQFALSFLLFGDSAVMKHILELKGFLSSTLNGLIKDPPEVVHFVVSTLQGRVVRNVTVTKKTKVLFFNSYVLTQLTSLYNYDNNEQVSGGDNDKPRIKEVVHELLVEVVCSFKYGICFGNKTGGLALRSNNPVLLRFLQSLSKTAMEDIMLQKLVVKMLCCCPDLIQPYLTGLQATYEPRLSVPWLSNINFLTKVYSSLSSPSQMMKTADVALTHSTLPTLVNMVVPIGLTRAVLSHGIQHTSMLVKHAILLVMTVILERTRDALEYFTNLDSGNTKGPPADFPSLVAEAVLKFLPAAQTLISVRQNLAVMERGKEAENEQASGSHVSRTIVTARVLQVMSGYQKIWPTLFTQAGFDLVKLFPRESGVSFPPLIQHATLQFLLTVPAGSFRWVHQKVKGSSGLYSILNIVVYTEFNDTAELARRLVFKMLKESGVLAGECIEIDTWLRYLGNTRGAKDSQSLLMKFFAEVCYSVAADPYACTDQVLEFVAEASAMQASEKSTLPPVTWLPQRRVLHRLPFSPLVVGALIQYSKLLTGDMSVLDKTAVLSLDNVGTYVNTVLLEILHTQTNPRALCLAICHYLESTKTAFKESLANLQTLKSAVVCYAQQWRTTTHMEARAEDHVKELRQCNVNALRHFLQESYENEELTTTSAKLFDLLIPLEESEWNQVIFSCLQFCRDKLHGDVSAVVRHLRADPFVLTDISVADEQLSLFQGLPFDLLLEQAFGHRNTNDPKGILLEHSGFLALLLDTLCNAPHRDSERHAQHVLSRLDLLLTTSVGGNCCCRSFETVATACFQMLQVIVRKCSPPKLEHSLDHNSQHIEETLQDSSSEKLELLETIVFHPLLCSWFLISDKDCEMKEERVKHIAEVMSCCISEFLLVVIDNFGLDRCKCIVQPFIDRVYQVALDELVRAEKIKGSTVQFSQVFVMLQQFLQHGENTRQSKLVSSLARLPSYVLLQPSSASHSRLVPTVYCMTLFAILISNAKESCHATPSSAETKLYVPKDSFSRLSSLVEAAQCKELDCIVHNVLQRCPHYVIMAPASMLVYCLENPTEERIAVAALLVESSPSVRVQFENICLPTQRNSLFIRKGLANTDTPFVIKWRKVILAYLSCVGNTVQHMAEHTKCAEVVKSLYNQCWPILWTSLCERKQAQAADTHQTRLLAVQLSVGVVSDFPLSILNTIERNYPRQIFLHKYWRYIEGFDGEELCWVMLRLIRLCDRVEENFHNDFERLVQIPRTRAWDRFQAMVAAELLQKLGCDCGESEKTVLRSRFVLAVIASFSKRLSGDQVPATAVDVETMLTYLSSLCKDTLELRDTQSRLVWNGFLKDALKHNLTHAQTTRTVAALIRNAYSGQEEAKGLLPLPTVFQMVLSHSRFMEVMLVNPKEQGDEVKEAIVELLICLAEMSSECYENCHPAMLLGSYGGSTSRADQSILYLIQLYEKHHISLADCRPFLWGQAAVEQYEARKNLGPSLWKQPGMNEVIEVLDACQLKKSAPLFPLDKELGLQLVVKQQGRNETDTAEPLYDPSFLLPLFSYLLSPNSEVDCRKFIERGCLGYVVSALASRDGHMRQAAYHVLARFTSHLEGATFKERNQIRHLLHCLRGGVNEANMCVSNVITCFVRQAAQILLRPDHPMYVLVNTYLLQRPVMDLKEVPLFYTMFNSSSMQFRSERKWILQLLVDGLRDSQDYYVYKRRHVLELAISFHDSQISDQHSRSLVMKLVAAACRIRPAAYDLVKRYGIIGWVHSLCLRNDGYEDFPSVTTLLEIICDTLWSDEQTTSGRTGIEVQNSSLTVPGNLAQECLLVCLTLLDCPSHDTESVCVLLKLLRSVVSKSVAKNLNTCVNQNHISKILFMWCDAFEETKVLEAAMTETGAVMLQEGRRMLHVSVRQEVITGETRLRSLKNLFGIITQWLPEWFHPECCHTVLLALNFGLRSVTNTRDIVLPLLIWFKTCVIQSSEIRNSMMKQAQTATVTLLFRMFYLYGEEKTHRAEAANPCSHPRIVQRELVCIFTTLLAHAEKVRQSGSFGDEDQIVALLHNEAYRSIMSAALPSLLAILSHPVKDESEQGVPYEEVVVELLSLLIKEVWLLCPSPRQFLSYLFYLSEQRSGTNSTGSQEVAQSAVKALGEKKFFSEWTKLEV